jgi:hypothetical protein
LNGLSKREDRPFIERFLSPQTPGASVPTQILPIFPGIADLFEDAKGGIQKKHTNVCIFYSRTIGNIAGEFFFCLRRECSASDGNTFEGIALIVVCCKVYFHEALHCCLKCFYR